MYVDPDGRSLLAIIIGAIIGAAVAFTGTVVADYADDGEVFNGSISVESYIANTLIGGIFGGALGGFSTTTFTFSLPTLGLMQTTARTCALAVKAVAVSVGGAEILVGAGMLGTLFLFASNNRPGNNKKQNQQFRDAMKELGIKNKDQMRRVHDRIKGRNMGYKDLIEFIKNVLDIR